MDFLYTESGERESKLLLVYMRFVTYGCIVFINLLLQLRCHTDYIVRRE